MRPSPPSPWGFVVSITRGGRHRKLHHVGSCCLVPRVDYATYETFGSTLPDKAEIDSICARCFKGEDVYDADQAEFSAESVSSSSSSTSLGREPGQKRPRLGQQALSLGDGAAISPP